MRRLWRYFPVVLVALAVQMLAPVAACWAGIAASDPLHAAIFCHGDADAAPGPINHEGNQSRAHDGCCAVCSVAFAGAPLDTPQISAITMLFLQSSRVVWLKRAPDRFNSRNGFHAQARAPPLLT